MGWGIIVVGLLLAALCMEPAEPPIPGYSCYRTLGEITIDGGLDEDSWAAAEPISPFMLYSGDKESPVKTTARMLWDDECLYVAFECEDTDIYATYTERDDPLWSQDVVEVIIMEQSLTQGHCLEYQVSPTGIAFDQYILEPYVTILEWNSKGFRWATKYDGTPNDPSDVDKGYMVEMAIPFADLHLRKSSNPTPKDGSTMRMNLYRIDYKCPEKIGDNGAEGIYTAWSPTIELAFHRPHRFGFVTFVNKPAGADKPEE